MPSIQKLVGESKTRSDLESGRVRVRYQEATTVNAGRMFRMTFPKRPGYSLDCSEIKMRCDVTTIYPTQASDTIVFNSAGGINGSLFNRVRVISGTSVIYDLSEASLYSAMQNVAHEDLGNLHANEGAFTGRGTLTSRAGYMPRDDINLSTTREFIFVPFPKGTILNRSLLLPLDIMQDLHVEFYLNTNLYALTSDDIIPPLRVEPDTTYNLSNIELLTKYVRSTSLTNFFQANGVGVTCKDVSHHYNAVTVADSLLRISSARTSVHNMKTLLRLAASVGTGASQDVTNTTDVNLPLNFGHYNLYVNSVLRHEEHIDSIQQMWEHMKDSFPNIEKNSNGYTVQEWPAFFVICDNLAAAPKEFHEKVQSGISTGKMNTDVVIKLFLTTLVGNLRADTFLESDVQIYLDAPGGSLRVRY
jgi:hypothetical protein